jgi:hypothetical protein
LPFIGYTYTENSLINDCQTLYDIIQSNSSIDYNASTKPANNETTKSTKEYECIIAELENEKIELTEKLNALQSLSLIENINNDSTTTTPNLNGAILLDSNVSKDLALKLDQSQQALLNSNEQCAQLNLKLNEMTSMYETVKQNELEEKNKIKHLERSVRALKIEKDQLFTVNISNFSFLFKKHLNIFFFFILTSKYSIYRNELTCKPKTYLRRRINVS